MSTQRGGNSLGYLSKSLAHYIVNMRWHVYDSYEIRDFADEEEHIIKDTSHFGGEKVASRLFEKIYIKESIKSSIYYPPGKYVTWFENDMSHNRIKHRYNPIEEGSDLLKRFLRLGHGSVPSRMVLSFVNKYGVLKEVEYADTELVSGFVYQRYPVDAIRKYAKETYYTQNLIHLISKNDIKLVRDSLKVVADNVMGGFEAISDPFKAIVDFGDFIYTWWHKMPEHFRSHLTTLMPKNEAEVIQLVGAGKKNVVGDKSVPMAFFMPSMSKEFWDIFTALAPNEMLIDYTDKLISAIIRNRLWKDVEVDPVMEGSFLNASESKTAYYIRPRSLLSAIWLLLYLDITGQSVNYYSFCDYCGGKILQKSGEKGYRGNIYCTDNHRNYAYNRDVKGVIELGKQGASLDFIKEAYPRRSEDSIIRWLDKEGVQVNK